MIVKIWISRKSVTGKGTEWEGVVTKIALCTSCSRAKKHGDKNDHCMKYIHLHIRPPIVNNLWYATIRGYEVIQDLPYGPNMNAF